MAIARVNRIRCGEYERGGAATAYTIREIRLRQEEKSGEDLQENLEQLHVTGWKSITNRL